MVTKHWNELPGGTWHLGFGSARWTEVVVHDRSPGRLVALPAAVRIVRGMGRTTHDLVTEVASCLCRAGRSVL
jgi:hypothetical protein